MDIIIGMSKKEATVIIDVLAYYISHIKTISCSISDDSLKEKIHSAQKIMESLYDIINSTGRRADQTTHNQYYGDDDDYQPLPYEVCQSTEPEEPEF